MRITDGKCFFCSKSGIFSATANTSRGHIPFSLCEEHKQLADILRYCIENQVSKHLLFMYMVQFEEDRQFFLSHPTPDHEIMLATSEKDFPKLEVFKMYLDMEHSGVKVLS